MSTGPAFRNEYEKELLAALESFIEHVEEMNLMLAEVILRTHSENLCLLNENFTSETPISYQSAAKIYEKFCREARVKWNLPQVKPNDQEFAEILERDLKSGYGPSRAELILLIESRDADLTRLARAQEIREAAAAIGAVYPDEIADPILSAAIRRVEALRDQSDKDALAERVQQAVREEAIAWSEHGDFSGSDIKWASERLAELRAAAGAPEEKKETQT